MANMMEFIASVAEAAERLKECGGNGPVWFAMDDAYSALFPERAFSAYRVMRERFEGCVLCNDMVPLPPGVVFMVTRIR